LVIETSLHYDAQSEKHQITGISLSYRTQYVSYVEKEFQCW